jgi:thiamine-phosphate pyrophosphorylase
MAAGGASFIQLREKKAPAREFYEAARHALAVARERGIRLIINDRVDIAMVLGADGVHLGQNDLSPVHARRLLGERAIIGWSTHTLEQAAEAVRLPIDYLAFGPVFATSTKEDPDPVVGLRMLSEVRSIAGGIPVVAIGGVNETNLREVLAAGADSAAVISAILAGSATVEGRVRSLLAAALNRETKDV